MILFDLPMPPLLAHAMMWHKHIWSTAGRLFVFLLFLTWAQTYSLGIGPTTVAPWSSPLHALHRSLSSASVSTPKEAVLGMSPPPLENSPMESPGLSLPLPAPPSTLPLPAIPAIIPPIPDEGHQTRPKGQPLLPFQPPTPLSVPLPENQPPLVTPSSNNPIIATPPLFGKSPLAPSQTEHQPLHGSIVAPAPIPTATCVGTQKLVRTSFWPRYQHLKCPSSTRPDCRRLPCAAPYTQTPLGSPCGCVLPMQIELELDVALDALFPTIPVLTEEIASGTLLLQSQVRVVGANADNQDQSKSVAEIDLVPLGKAFDNLTAFMIFQRFWNHEVLISDSYFGNYTPIYVHYPGLPSSMSPYPSGTTSGGLPGAGIWPHEQPLSVDVGKRGQKFSGGTMALILVSSVIAAAATFGVLLLLFLKFNNRVAAIRTTAKTIYMCAQKRSGGVFISSSELGRSPSGLESSLSGSFSSSMATYTTSARTFSLYELERATNNFNSRNVVGQGGFGRVFCGMLEDGSKVAVKIITRNDQQRGKEFIAEVEMLSRLHHRNLVKLIGVCTEEHSRCLVYELISNGSVESHLHGTDKHVTPLDWNARMKIALGAARGLAYLHEDANPRVIHRDFKASNILLEQDFTPKISDFGLAKAAPDEENGHISTTVMGTFGYVAPEYAMTGHLLVKSDVYSYGVVLLELLSGKKPIDLSQASGEENLVNWARPLLSSKECLEILADPALEGNFSFDNFSRVAAIASMCVQPEVSHRPFMGEVVQALKLVCNNSEGVFSITVSPQDSAGGSDGSSQPRADGSGPMNTTGSTSFISVEYDSGTAHVTSRESERPESSLILSSDSDYLNSKLSDSFRRHSTSGPSSSTGTNNSAWSIERDYVRITMSEHRAIRHLEKCGKGEMRGIWL